MPDLSTSLRDELGPVAKQYLHQMEIPPERPSTWERLAGLVRNPKYGKYRDPLPKDPDRMLVVVHDGIIVQHVDHIGPGMDDVWEGTGGSDLLGSKELGDGDSGLYVFEGTIEAVNCWTNWETGYVEDYDLEWHGEWRRCTAEEVAYASREETIWDSHDWYEPELVPSSHEPA